MLTFKIDEETKITFKTYTEHAYEIYFSMHGWDQTSVNYLYKFQAEGFAIYYQLN